MTDNFSDAQAKFEVDKFLGWIAQWQVKLKKTGKGYGYQLTEREIDIAEEGWNACKAEIVKWLVKNAVGKWKVSLVDAANHIDKEF